MIKATCSLAFDLEAWILDCVNNFVIAQVFLFQNLFLDLLWEVALEGCRLNFEIFVEFLEILYVVVNKLRLLLLL